MSFRDNPNFVDLQKHYKDCPLALYTGAGVSAVSKETAAPVDGIKYGLDGWEALLRAVLAKSKSVDKQEIEKYENEIAVRHRTEPWKIADWVERRIGTEKFMQFIIKVIQSKANFPVRQNRASSTDQPANRNRPPKKYKQLGGSFLRDAHTLNAVAAFCARLTNVVRDARPNTYRVTPNPRVPAVLTSNYDPFLEAASSAMFIRHLLKPVSAKGSTAGTLREIPVFHIHGYVQYPKRGQKRPRGIKAWVNPVVTSDDYVRAWNLKDPFNFTMGPQIHVLRHYSTLFVGFSFRDEWVNGLLRKLKKERKGYDKPFSHFALMKRDSVEQMGARFFEELGVKVIAFDEYEQIPAIFGDLYQAGLNADFRDGVVRIPAVGKAVTLKKNGDADKSAARSPAPVSEFTPQQVWDQLRACRNSYAKKA